MDTEELRTEAKVYCTTQEDWRIVGCMSKGKLKNFIEQKEFEQSQHLRNSVFSGVHRALAFVVDRVGKGEGYIQSALLEDKTLQASIEQEALPFLTFLNNRLKIAMLKTL